MVLDFIQFTGKRESRWGIVICLSLPHEERLYTIGDPSSCVMFVHNQKGYGRTPGVDPSLYNQTGVACKWKKIPSPVSSCRERLATSTLARMPVRLRGFLRYNDVVRPLYRIVEVKGSIPYKPDFFFRLSFHICRSCVYNCNDLLSYETFVCHMHTPTPPL